MTTGAVVRWLDARTLTPEQLALLSPAEHDRVARFRRAGDRAVRRAAAVLLRQAVAEAIGAHPADVVVTRHCPT